MKRSRALLLLPLGWALGCSHTQTVGDTEAKSSEAARETKPSADKKPHRDATVEDRSHPTDGSLPIFTTPGGALKPGGASKIQERLVAKNQLAAEDASGELDDRTRRALRAFQRGNGIPATGIPDDATVHQLGLKPSDVFRTAPVPSPARSP